MVFSSSKAGSVSDDEHTATAPNWFRGTLFQATVVSLAAFIAPGLWNAMQSTGAGGAQEPYLVNAGNALLFGLMTFTCLSGSVVSNRVGIKTTFILGTTGYALYSAALYCNNRYGTEWFIYLGSAACGISAGLFWAAEGAIMIGYPEEHKRGRYLAYWLAGRNSGSILGGAINLALNVTGNTKGKLDWRTYIIFVVLQALGPGIAALLSPPEKVQRDDRTPVKMTTRNTDKEELKALLKLLISKEILLVTPVFLYAAWSLAYIGTYLSLYFSVRSRALASLVSALAQVLVNAILGSFLDWRTYSFNFRARWAYIGMVTLIGAAWTWGTVVQNDYSKQDAEPSFDWVDAGWARGWVLYIFWQINFAVIYNYCYWLVGGIAKKETELIRYTSILRGIEAAGQAVAYGINATSIPMLGALGINFGLWAIGVIPAWLVVRKVGLDKAEEPSPPSEIAESDKRRM